MRVDGHTRCLFLTTNDRKETHYLLPATKGHMPSCKLISPLFFSKNINS